MTHSVAVTTSVKCAFCKRVSSKNRDIECEGYKKNMKQILKFNSSQEYRKHLKTYCERFCESCPIYQLIMREKYDNNI